jgi:prepilin-type N-terminal cleavage/methylation domain-containing protein
MIVILGMRNYRNLFTSKTSGFTLIELLIVMSILSILMAMVGGNYISSLKRGRDVKRKAELGELKTALQLFYQDNQSYPAYDHEFIKGCGEEGNFENCEPKNVCPDHEKLGEFATYAAGESCGSLSSSKLYMKTLPRNPSKMTELSFTYLQNGDDDFCLSTDLEKTDDKDIAASQSRCSSACGVSAGHATYEVCAN